MVFTGVDVGVAVLVLISAVLATARGFTREVLSLATWAGSAAIAAYMYFYHRDLAEKYIDNQLIATGVTVVGTFIVALIVLHLLTMWIGDMVVDSRVGPLDRTLGFVFGAARGVLICMVGVLFAIWLLSGTATVKTVDSACTQSATPGPASASAPLQQACVSYAAAQTPQNEKTLLATCVAFIRENPKPASDLEKACAGYVALLGPRGEPDLPVMLATAKSVQPLEEGAYWLIGLLPNDVESELLNILQKHGQSDTEADTKKQVDGDGGDASAPADPTGGAAPSAPAA